MPLTPYATSIAPQCRPTVHYKKNTYNWHIEVDIMNKHHNPELISDVLIIFVLHLNIYKEFPVHKIIRD